MTQSAFDRVMGETEIMADPAALVTEADKSVVDYMQRGYKLADKIWVGLGDGAAIPAQAGAIPGTATIVQNFSNPMKPLKLGFSSQYAPDLYMTSFSYGAVSLVDGAGVPMDMFTEAALLGDVSFPTIQTSQNVSIGVRNNGAIASRLSMAMYVIRLRGG